MRLIDADAVRDVIAELNENGYDISPSDLAFVQNILLLMPTIEPKRGKWIAEPNCWYRCSNCGQHYPSIRGYMDYKYCPNCGARMERSEDGEA